VRPSASPAHNHGGRPVHAPTASCHLPAHSPSFRQWTFDAPQHQVDADTTSTRLSFILPSGRAFGPVVRSPYRFPSLSKRFRRNAARYGPNACSMTVLYAPRSDGYCAELASRAAIRGAASLALHTSATPPRKQRPTKRRQIAAARGAAGSAPQLDDNEPMPSRNPPLPCETQDDAPIDRHALHAPRLRRPSAAQPDEF